MSKCLEAVWFHEEVLRLVDHYVLQWTEASHDGGRFLESTQTPERGSEVAVVVDGHVVDFENTSIPASVQCSTSDHRASEACSVVQSSNSTTFQ